MKQKKLTLRAEFVYLLAVVLLALSSAMCAVADLGLSMIVAPAYILSEKVPFITFGMAEYMVQGLLFIVMCIVMKRVRLSYFMAFVTSVLFGLALDAWRLLPCFNEAVTPPGSMAMVWRILLFAGGAFITALAIALFFRVYLPPEVCDLFVKCLHAKYGWDLTKIKRINDAAFLAVGLALTLIFFHKLVGIGVGTFVVTLVNGPVIGFIGKGLDRFVEIKPAFPKLAEKFAL